MKATASVVIPALNAEETLAEQLAALATQTFSEPWEIVVVNNGSTDRTAEVAAGAATHPQCNLRVIDEPRRGLNVARNTGVREASAALIAICDADDIVSPQWLESLVAALAKDDVICGSLEVRVVNSPETLAWRGWEQLNAPLPSISRELNFLDQVICGNVAFHRHVWSIVGEFDESFAGGGDDVDFGWRVQLSGYTVGACDHAVLHYRARTDRRALFRQYARDGEGSAHLYKRYRAHGMPGRSVAHAVKTCIWLSLRLPTIGHRPLAVQGQLVRAAGKQWGRIRGSVKHHVVYL